MHSPHPTIGHIHGPGPYHHHESELSSKLTEYVFPYDPLSNAVIAVSLLTAVTQTLIAASPKLSGSLLQFLVAYAEGSMLATVFIHMLPEIRLTLTSSLLILTGFLLFVVVDKAMRIASGSHTHAHSHSTAAGQNEKHPAKPEKEESAISPWLNVIADSLHNVTDGVSLGMAFHVSPAHGFAAFLVMCTHEIPHQFGDFALLINSGISKSIARKGQLLTAAGTLIGVLLGSYVGALSAVFSTVVIPLTAGVFLYVATVNVLPELLETDSTMSFKRNITMGIVQLFGIVAGICTLVVMDGGH